MVGLEHRQNGHVIRQQNQGDTFESEKCAFHNSSGTTGTDIVQGKPEILVTPSEEAVG